MWQPRRAAPTSCPAHRGLAGRIARKALESKRYTLGDLAEDIAEASGADAERDFYPANLVTPVSRFLEKLDGKPKIRTSCHSECGLGTYFFITPDGELIPIPRMFDINCGPSYRPCVEQMNARPLEG